MYTTEQRQSARWKYWTFSPRYSPSEISPFGQFLLDSSAYLLTFLHSWRTAICGAVCNQSENRRKRTLSDCHLQRRGCRHHCRRAGGGGWGLGDWCRMLWVNWFLLNWKWWTIFILCTNGYGLHRAEATLGECQFFTVVATLHNWDLASRMWTLEDI